MRKVILEVILKLTCFLKKKFGEKQKKTSTTIIIHDIHVDKIEVNVYSLKNK